MVLKRAQYFVTCGGRALPGMRMDPDAVLRALIAESRREALPGGIIQTSMSRRRIRPPRGRPAWKRRYS